MEITIGMRRLIYFISELQDEYVLLTVNIVNNMNMEGCKLCACWVWRNAYSKN